MNGLTFKSSIHMLSFNGSQDSVKISIPAWVEFEIEPLMGSSLDD